MGDGDARELRGGDGRGHARDDGAGNARFGERRKFLAAPPEHEGVAPLQADGERVFPSARDEQRVDLRLRHAVRTRPLPDADLLAPGRREGEQSFVEERVVDDTVRTPEKLRAPQCDHSLAAARADQNDAVHANASASAEMSRASRYEVKRMTPSFWA